MQRETANEQKKMQSSAFFSSFRRFIGHKLNTWICLQLVWNGCIQNGIGGKFCFICDFLVMEIIRVSAFYQRSWRKYWLLWCYCYLLADMWHKYIYTPLLFTWFFSVLHLYQYNWYGPHTFTCICVLKFINVCSILSRKPSRTKIVFSVVCRVIAIRRVFRLRSHEIHT